jgi:predicted GNAT superfamily acetyltransferase
MTAWTGLDRNAVLALNAMNEVETSPLDATGLEALLAQAFHVGLCDRGRDAFLIAFDQDAAYASPNFQWFRARYARFVYIDRVIVASGARGRGLARSLYRELFAAAAGAGHTLITCEVNLRPPNPASHALHASLGFTEAGRGGNADAAKVVSYLVRTLDGSFEP